MESHKKVYGIMAFCADKAEDKGNVRMKGRVVAGKLEESIAEIIFSQITVLSPEDVGGKK